MEGEPISRPAWNPVVAFALALGVAFATFVLGRVLPESVTTQYPWTRTAASQGLMLAFALVAMGLSRWPFARFGFRRPAPARSYFKLWGLALGTAGSGVILVLGLRGMREDFADYGLLGVLLSIWVVSPLVEEVFCRAWFQTLAGADTPAAVLLSAALFGAMHLPLLFGDREIAAVAIILLSVTVLGYVCAMARARTGSLRPAILAHLLFNVGGVLGGIIYTIGYRVATGQMPPT
jgi:membrane protease YdiL (CAAX protease family)